MKNRRRRMIYGGIVALMVFLFLVRFPGRQAHMALSLGTGMGIQAWQIQIDALEKKAIQKQPFTEDEIEFLKDLYETMAKGALLVPPLRQSGRLMDHYLEKKGGTLSIDPAIFSENHKVQAKMAALRHRLKKRTNKPVCTKRFYMPDRSVPDSLFGLYFGTLCATRSTDGDIMWRAEVPWEWPSYESLKKKYGTPHAESFPLPNPRSLIYGKRYALHIDNGLGEYLTRLNLAEPFVAVGEWRETAEFVY